MNIDDYITVDSNRYDGEGVLKGTDHPVGYILSLLGDGKTFSEILSKHPDIKSEEAIKAALGWAANNLKADVIYEQPHEFTNQSQLINDSKLIMDNALSFAYIKSGLCRNALHLSNFQSENKLPENLWLYYYWNFFRITDEQSFWPINELQVHYGLPRLFLFQESEPLALYPKHFIAKLKEQKNLTPEFIQQAIIEKCREFAREECERKMRQQQADEDYYESKYNWNTKGSSNYNENLDMDQQDQDYWDDMESQDF